MIGGMDTTRTVPIPVTRQNRHPLLARLRAWWDALPSVAPAGHPPERRPGERQLLFNGRTVTLRRKR